MSDIYIILYIAVGVIVILLGWVIRLEIKVRRMFGGQKAKDFEEVVHYIHNAIKSLDKSRKEASLHLENLEKRMKTSVRGIETLRFNPFKGTGAGGNQSFSTAMVDEKGNGVVLSSLYSRERVSIFSKPIKEFSSEYELTDEEKGVIEKAKGSVHNH